MILIYISNQMYITVIFLFFFLTMYKHCIVPQNKKSAQRFSLWNLGCIFIWLLYAIILYAITFSVHHVEYGRFIPKAPKDAISYMFNFLFQSCSFAVYAWRGFFSVCGADDIDVIFHFCNVLFDCRTEEKTPLHKSEHVSRLRDRCSV